MVKKCLKSLVFWVILGIVLGVIFGNINEDLSKKSVVFAQDFIKALKLLIGPIIFTTIVLGIIGLENLKKLGSLGIKALIYFEVVSTIALAIGIFMANVMKPGAGMNMTVDKLDQSQVDKVAKYAEQGANTEISAKNEIMHILHDAWPTDIFSPFTNGKTIQVLVIAMITAFIVALMRDEDKAYIQKALEIFQNFLFKILQIIMYFSPLAAFGAIASMVATYGLAPLINLGYLLVVMLVSCLVFIFGVLGIICYMAKVNIFKFMRFIFKEVIVVFATSSSESALPILMKKLEKAGIDKSTVGLVLPTGYSFNLDCTNIYLAMSLIFLAQAFNVPLTLGHEISILIVLMIASKGAVGVTGSGFIVLGATLGALSNMQLNELGAGMTLGDVLPAIAISLLLGVDKFMSEMRACGNLCGNSVACLIVAIWDKQIDMQKFQYALDHPEEFND